MTTLFIHGMEDEGSSWKQTVAALDPELDCVTPDFPWRMFSDFSWLCDGSAEQVVTAELERVRPDVCVAHSFGALALVESLLDAPADLQPQAIVLIAPFFLGEAERLDWRLLDRTREEFTRLMRDSIVTRSQQSGRQIADDVLDGMVDKLMSGINPLVFTELFRHFALLRRRPLEALRIRGRLVGSENDPGFAGDRAPELSSRLGLQLTLLPGRDHFLHYTAPQTVADTIQSLLVEGVHA